MRKDCAGRHTARGSAVPGRTAAAPVRQWRRLSSTSTEPQTEAGIRRIGLFGGTFNPVHIGHLVLARDVCEHFGLDRLDFILALLPPHKLRQSGELAPAEHRWAMLQRALRGEVRLRASRVELDRGGTSYTIDTVRAYRAAFPQAELCLVIGADSLFELRTWRESARLAQLCRIIAVARPGWIGRAVTPEAVGFAPAVCAQIERDLQTARSIDIQATEIRARCGRGLSIRWLVPEPVDEYIAQVGIYRSGPDREPRESHGGADEPSPTP